MADGGNTAKLTYLNGTIYGQDGVTGSWYAWNGSDFSPASSDPSGSARPVFQLAASGTADYMDSAGSLWAADNFYSGTSQTSVYANAIAKTSDAQLYNGERYGADAGGNAASFAYTFSAPAGNYSVTLMFAETYCTAAKQRLFSVVLNGSTVLTNFDIFAASGGMNIAVNKTFVVKVTSGNPNIQIVFAPGSINNAKIDAIAITPVN